MKKALTIICLALTLALVGCSNLSTETKSTNTSNSVDNNGGSEQSSPEKIVEAMEKYVNNKDSQMIFNIGMHKAEQNVRFERNADDTVEKAIACLDNLFETKLEDLKINMKIVGNGVMEESIETYKNDYYDRYGVEVEEFEIKKVNIDLYLQQEKTSYEDDMFFYKIAGKWYGAMPDFIYRMIKEDM